MPRLDPVGAICQPSKSGCGDNGGPQFICCVDGRQPKIQKVCIFREDGVTPKVRPTAKNVGTFVHDYFSTMWLGVPSFLRNDGTPWNLNLMDTYYDWGGRGSSTSQNLSSGSGGYSDSVFINWNRPARVLPIYHLRIFENTHSAVWRAHGNIVMENLTYSMQIPSTCRNPIHGCSVNWKDATLNDSWGFSVHQ